MMTSERESEQEKAREQIRAIFAGMADAAIQVFDEGAAEITSLRALNHELLAGLRGARNHIFDLQIEVARRRGENVGDANAHAERCVRDIDALIRKAEEAK